MSAASCFYCRRGMHDSCVSGETACPCCAAWRCDAHNIWTSGDCPKCDDELIALTEETSQAEGVQP